MSFADSLRGYGFPIHRRDGFRCQYCDLDGSKWPHWLSLSIDHLLPKNHPERDEDEFIVTACMFCNTADNQFFSKAKQRGLKFDNMTRQELIKQRRPYVKKVRRAYRAFWTTEVEGTRGRSHSRESRP